MPAIVAVVDEWLIAKAQVAYDYLWDRWGIKGQFDALVKTSGALQRGELVHLTRDGFNTEFEGLSRFFNMEEWQDEYGCGSVCCIGGWAEEIGKVSLGEVPSNLEALFYPNHYNDRNGLTAAQAGDALCHYLKTGDHGYKCWNRALGKPDDHDDS